MAVDARDLTTLWRDIEEVTDALEAAIAQLVRSPQPHPKLVEALMIGEASINHQMPKLPSLPAAQQVCCSSTADGR
jgi:hypothetical protein